MGATVGKVYDGATACAGGAVAGTHPDDFDAGGLLPAAILKATRGIPQSGTAPAITATPTACIGPDVFFNNVLNTGLALGVPSAAAVTTQQTVALCDPNGCIPGQDCQGAPCWWWCWCCQQSRGRHYCEWGYSHSLRCSDFQPKPRLLRRDCGCCWRNPIWGQVERAEVLGPHHGGSGLRRCVLLCCALLR